VSVAAEAERATDLLRLHGAPGSVIETVATATEIALRYSASVEVQLELDDGDNVPAGGSGLRAHLRPGHSSADLVLADDTGWAIVGDHLLLAGATPLVADDGGAEAAAFANVLRTYRTSLTATATQGLTVALAGHGDVVEGPAALIATRLAAQDRRVERLRDAFGGAPQTAWELVESVRRGRPFDTDVHPLAPAFIALADVLAYLGPLAADRRIRQVEAGNGTIAFEPL
jgi:glyoxylase-like metal-dependent hydrolase (beta-lactamase superfamily II)